MLAFLDATTLSGSTYEYEIGLTDTAGDGSTIGQVFYAGPIAVYSLAPPTVSSVIATASDNMSVALSWTSQKADLSDPSYGGVVKIERADITTGSGESYTGTTMSYSESCDSDGVCTGSGNDTHVLPGHKYMYRVSESLDGSSYGNAQYTSPAIDLSQAPASSQTPCFTTPYSTSPEVSGLNSTYSSAGFLISGYAFKQGVLQSSGDGYDPLFFSDVPIQNAGAWSSISDELVSLFPAVSIRPVITVCVTSYLPPGSSSGGGGGGSGG